VRGDTGSSPPIPSRRRSADVCLHVAIAFKGAFAQADGRAMNSPPMRGRNAGIAGVFVKERAAGIRTAGGRGRGARTRHARTGDVESTTGLPTG